MDVERATRGERENGMGKRERRGEPNVKEMMCLHYGCHFTYSLSPSHSLFSSLTFPLPLHLPLPLSLSLIFLPPFSLPLSLRRAGLERTLVLHLCPASLSACSAPPLHGNWRHCSHQHLPPNTSPPSTSFSCYSDVRQNAAASATLAVWHYTAVHVRVWLLSSSAPAFVLLTFSSYITA